jgi:hypothetical protein
MPLDAAGCLCKPHLHLHLHHTCTAPHLLLVQEIVEEIVVVDGLLVTGF